MKSMAEARVKRLRAVELAEAGHSYEEIAKRVGFVHRGSAYRAVRKALAAHEAGSVEEFRALENARLDAMLAGLWPAIEEGDLRAIDGALRITDRRIRLNGLDVGTNAARPQPRLLVPGEG